MGNLKEVDTYYEIPYLYSIIIIFLNFRFCISLYHCNHHLMKKLKYRGTPPLRKNMCFHMYVLCITKVRDNHIDMYVAVRNQS